MAPKLGALGVTFAAMRAIQFVAFVTIVGMTANFVNRINTSNHDAPGELVGTLVVATTGIVYVVITSILYWDEILPSLVSAGLDTLLFIAAVVVSVLLGKPLSKTNCDALPSSSSNATFGLSTNATQAAQATQATSGASTTYVYADYSSFQRRDGHNDSISKTLTYLTFIATDKSTCLQVKAIWGFSISMAVTFAFSVLVCVGLWYRTCREAGPKEDGGEAAAAAAQKNVDACSDTDGDDGSYRYDASQAYGAGRAY